MQGRMKERVFLIYAGMACAMLFIIMTPTAQVGASMITVFQDNFEEWANINSPNPQIGSIQSWLNAANNNHDIITTTGPDGSSTQVLKIDKVANQSTAWRANLIAYDPSQFLSMRISLDYKPISGGADAADTFGSAAEVFRVSDDTKFSGDIGLWRSTERRNNEPLSGQVLYTRAPGAGLGTILDGGGRGEIYTTDDGTTPDGTWYHFSALLTMPDANGNYQYDLSFTPYHNDGTLNAAATATYSTTGTYGEAGYFGSVLFSTRAAGAAEYYVDNVEVTVIPEPGSLALLALAGGVLLYLRHRR